MLSILSSVSSLIDEVDREAGAEQADIREQGDEAAEEANESVEIEDEAIKRAGLMPKNVPKMTAHTGLPGYS